MIGMRLSTFCKHHVENNRSHCSIVKVPLFVQGQGLTVSIQDIYIKVSDFSIVLTQLNCLSYFLQADKFVA